MVQVSSLTIREALESERPLVAEITKQSYSEYATESDPKFWQQYIASTEDTLLHKTDVLRLVAVEQDKITAAVLLCPPYENILGGKVVRNIYPEMRLLAVLPEHRNTGLGALLIDECERRTRANNFEAITLHTTVLMKTAKAMYERRGYSRYSQIDFEPVPGFVVWGYIKHFAESAR